MNRILLAMLSLAVLSITTAVAIAQTPTTEGNSTPKVSITIAPDESEIVRCGSPVRILVTTANISDQPFKDFRKSNFDNPYKIDVRDVHGEVVAETEEFRKEQQAEAANRGSLKGSVRGSVLQPGQRKIEFLAISDYYDLGKPGKYTVQVYRKRAASNKITMTVVPSSDCGSS